MNRKKSLRELAEDGVRSLSFDLVRKSSSVDFAVAAYDDTFLPDVHGNMLAKRPGIVLEDHTLDPTDNSSGLWARSARVVDYIIVGGGKQNAAMAPGAYVAWNCVIETFEGVKFSVRKRYSEFLSLREKLIFTFPHSEQFLPPLPPKSFISRFRPKFLESRRQGLSYFLSCVILNPEFAGSPIVREFLLKPRD